MLSPSNTTLPVAAWRKPEMQLKSVVLPAPFGPINAVIEARATSSDTSLTAIKPPKRTDICRAERIAPSALKRVLLAVAEDALRPPDDQHDECQPDENQTQVGPVPGGKQRQRPEVEEAGPGENDREDQ